MKRWRTRPEKGEKRPNVRIARVDTNSLSENAKAWLLFSSSWNSLSHLTEILPFVSHFY